MVCSVLQTGEALVEKRREQCRSRLHISWCTLSELCSGGVAPLVTPPQAHATGSLAKVKSTTQPLSGKCSMSDIEWLANKVAYYTFHIVSFRLHKVSWS